MSRHATSRQAGTESDLTVKGFQQAAVVQAGAEEEDDILAGRGLSHQVQGPGDEGADSRRRRGAHALEGGRQGRQTEQRQRHAACGQGREEMAACYLAEHQLIK